jgi:hypothetical protein
MIPFFHRPFKSHALYMVLSHCSEDQREVEEGSSRLKHAIVAVDFFPDVYATEQNLAILEFQSG